MESDGRGRSQMGGGGVRWRVESDGRGAELGGGRSQMGGGGVRWRVESDGRGRS